MTLYQRAFPLERGSRGYLRMVLFQDFEGVLFGEVEGTGFQGYVAGSPRLKVKGLGKGFQKASEEGKSGRHH
jgi:hypothetical protein